MVIPHQATKILFLQKKGGGPKQKGVHDPFLERIRRGRIQNFSLDPLPKNGRHFGTHADSRPAWLKVSQKSVNSHRETRVL